MFFILIVKYYKVSPVKTISTKILKGVILSNEEDNQWFYTVFVKCYTLTKTDKKKNTDNIGRNI